MREVSEAWILDEEANDDNVRIGLLVGNKVEFAMLSNAARAELSAQAGSDGEPPVNALLLRAVRKIAAHKPYGSPIIVSAPLELP